MSSKNTCLCELLGPPDVLHVNVIDPIGKALDEPDIVDSLISEMTRIVVEPECFTVANIGCVLFALLMFSRYSDLFDSLLSRAAVFLVLGAALFAVGNFYSRHKASGSISPSGESSRSKETAQ